MFSDAISSIFCCCRFSSSSMARAIFGSEFRRLEEKKPYSPKSSFRDASIRISQATYRAITPIALQDVAPEATNRLEHRSSAEFFAGVVTSPEQKSARLL